jgi:hypothetical protein
LYLTKGKKIYPRGYRCLLDVLGPSGLLASETRQCQVIGQLTSDKSKEPALLQRSSAQESLDEDVFAEASKIDRT